MKESRENAKKVNSTREFDLKNAQKRYFFGAVAILPFLPFLYLQGQYVRLKVGKLPDAAGATTGEIGSGENALNLLAIGESSIAGVGAKNHREAFVGQFSKHLSNFTGQKVRWNVFGVSGITVRRAINEIVPKLPETEIDVIVLAFGANDVFAGNGPKRWGRNLTELIEILQVKYPNAEVFLANVPMIRDFIALPNPLRYSLSRLAKLTHFSTIDLVDSMKCVYYFEKVDRVTDEFFCEDGVHPSPKGYDLWSAELVKDYLNQSKRFSK